MASKAKLIKQIKAESEKRGLSLRPDIDVDESATHAELVEELANIRAVPALPPERDTETETETEQDSAPAEQAATQQADLRNQPAAAETHEAPDAEYVMAPGKCITSQKGMLEPGMEVRAEWLTGGKETFEARIKSGHIISTKA